MPPSPPRLTPVGSRVPLKSQALHPSDPHSGPLILEGHLKDRRRTGLRTWPQLHSQRTPMGYVSSMRQAAPIARRFQKRPSHVPPPTGTLPGPAAHNASEPGSWSCELAWGAVGRALGCGQGHGWVPGCGWGYGGIWNCGWCSRMWAGLWVGSPDCRGSSSDLGFMGGAWECGQWQSGLWAESMVVGEVQVHGQGCGWGPGYGWLWLGVGVVPIRGRSPRVCAWW